MNQNCIDANIAVLMNALKVGEAEAIHAEQLADFLRVKPRKLRKIVLNARRAGCCILSSSKGYFLPGTDGEKRKFLHMMTTAAISRLTSITAAKMDESGNMQQYTLEDWGVM